jgi:hypothetical protein
MRTMIKEGPQTGRYPEDLDEILDHVELASQANHEPTEEQVARRANQIWRLKGCPEGTADADWFEATEQLKELYR